MSGGGEGDEQSVMTIVDVLRSLENSAGEPMDTVEGILMLCCVVVLSVREVEWRYFVSSSFGSGYLALARSLLSPTHGPGEFCLYF